MSHHLRRTRLALGALLCCVALMAGACASLPEAGAPQPFDVSVPDAGPVDLAAGGPTKGSSPEELISDFLLASAAGSTDDFATARLYLTSQEAGRWRPDAQVEVYPTQTAPNLSVTTGTQGSADVSLDVPAVASIDDAGLLTRTEDSSSVSRQFHLVQESGEWRIDSLDDGIVLSQASFAASYRLANLYFPSTTGDVLVADPRWYPAKRLATHLLTGLVAGPRASLAGAVTTAVPEGTTIPSQGMEISDHVAKVALSATLPSDQSTEQLLAWQVVETLTQADTVSSVELTVSGTVVPTDALPSSPTYRLDSAVGVTKDGLSLLTGSTLHKALGSDVVGPAPVQPAIGPVNSSLLAWSAGDAVTVRDVDTGATAKTTVASPTWPSIDRFGWTWSMSSGTTSATPVALAASGARVELKAPFSDSSTVAALRIAPDGARVLMLRVVGSTRSVWVAPLQRTTDGTPKGLGVAIEVSGLSSGVLDASWAGSQTLVALRSDTTTPGGDLEVAVVPLGGFVTTLSAPTGAQALSAGGSASDILVGTSRGGALARSGSVWQAVGAEVSDLHYPG